VWEEVVQNLVRADVERIGSEQGMWQEAAAFGCKTALDSSVAGGSCGMVFKGCQR
jgi:hypothetical protein